MLSGGLGPETRSRARPASDREILEAEEHSGSDGEDELVGTTERRGQGKRVVSDGSMVSGQTEAEDEEDGEEEEKGRPDDGTSSTEPREPVSEGHIECRNTA